MEPFFSRQRLLEEIGIEGQHRLGASRVLVVGVGGLGCPAALYLAAAGVGTIDLVDDDIVDETNLHRQILFHPEDIGHSKARVAAERLSKQFRHTQFRPYQQRLVAANAAERIQDCDVVLDGSDNFSTKFLLGDICAAASKPLVYGSVNRFEGQVAVFNVADSEDELTPVSYRDIFPAATPAEVGGSCAEVGVLGVVPGIVGILQALETVKVLLGRDDAATKFMLTLDLLSLCIDRLPIRRRPTSAPAVGANQEPLLFRQDPEHLVTPKDLVALMESGGRYQLVDIRTEEERATGHIPSISIPSHELDDRVLELDTSVPIILYCQSGIRSYGAVLRFLSMGFRVKSLQGGYTNFGIFIRGTQPAATSAQITPGVA